MGGGGHRLFLFPYSFVLYSVVKLIGADISGSRGGVGAGWGVQSVSDSLSVIPRLLWCAAGVVGGLWGLWD